MAKWHFRAITVKRDAVCWCEGRGCTLSSRLREGEPDTKDQQAVPDLILAATSASQITLSLYAITLAWVSRLSRNETFPEASRRELIQKTYCYWANLSYTCLSFNLQNWTVQINGNMLCFGGYSEERHYPSGCPNFRCKGHHSHTPCFFQNTYA